MDHLNQRSRSTCLPISSRIFWISLVMAAIFLASPFVEAAERCRIIMAAEPLRNLARRFVENLKERLKVSSDGYGHVDIREYISEKESEEVLRKLIQVNPYGQINLLIPENVTFLTEVVGKDFVTKLFNLAESYRIQMSEMFGEEVGRDYATALLQFRWTDGTKNLVYDSEWHYDGYWFTIGTTLVGEGTNYSLADRQSAKQWGPGQYYSSLEIPTDATNSSPRGNSIVYTAIDRAYYYLRKMQTVLPLLHKGSSKFLPRLFLVQSLN